MTKAKFFELLAANLKAHNRGADSYRSAQFRAAAFHDVHDGDNKPKDWVDHAATIVLADCWYMTFTTHKTAEAAEKQTATFARWLIEWQIGDGIALDIEINKQEKAQREANVKRLIHCCEHHDVSITRADAEAIVDSFNGAFVLGTAWKQARDAQTERRRADVMTMTAQHTEGSTLADATRRILAMTREQVDHELAFLTCRFTMTMDDLIAAACNADDPHRKAADLEMLHRVGTLSNLVACANGL